MTERQKEVYRSDYLNNGTGEDFVTLPSYQFSLQQAPKLSMLRMAIAPGSVKYMNQGIPQWIEIPSTILQTEGGDGVTEKKKVYSDDDYEYMSYKTGYSS